MRRALGILADSGALALLVVVLGAAAVIRWVWPCRYCGGSGGADGGRCEVCEGWGL